VAWWCNGYDVGRATQGFAVRLPAVPLSGNNLRQVVHTHVLLSSSSIINTGQRRWCPTAGKVTVGLASHWPCVTLTDFSGLSTYGLNGLRKGDEHPAYTPYKEYGTLYLLPLHPRLLMPPWLGTVPQYQIVVSPLRVYPLTT